MIFHRLRFFVHLTPFPAYRQAETAVLRLQPVRRNGVLGLKTSAAGFGAAQAPSAAAFFCAAFGVYFHNPSPATVSCAAPGCLSQ